MEPSREVIAARTRLPVGALLLGLVTLVLVVGIVLLTIAGASGHTSSGGGSAAANQPSAVPSAAAPTVVPSETATAAPAIARETVMALLNRYVRAYDDEDVGAIGAMLASDVTRRSGTASQRGIDDVMAEYQRQFDALQAPRYVLAGVSIDTTSDEATVEARYSISSDAAPTSTGAIAFHLVADADQLEIHQITAVPDA